MHFNRHARVPAIRRSRGQHSTSECDPAWGCRPAQTERQGHLHGELECIHVSIVISDGPFHVLTRRPTARQYAFPHDDLTPISKSWTDGRNGWGASLVDGLTTLVSFRNRTLINVCRLTPLQQAVMGEMVRYVRCQHREGVTLTSGVLCIGCLPASGRSHCDRRLHP